MKKNVQEKRTRKTYIHVPQPGNGQVPTHYVDITLRVQQL